MDLSLAKWLSEQGMDDEPAFMNQSQMSSLYDDTFDFESFSSEIDEKPAKKLMTNKKTTMASNSSSSSTIISFGNSNSPPDRNSNQFHGNLNWAVLSNPRAEMVSYGNISEGAYEGTERVSAPTRTRLQAQDHVLAERKRREKLTQRFVALSALLPGLKKLDKASVLGDAINHITQLQERVNTLEHEAKERNNIAEATVVSSCDDNWDGLTSFPEMEVRVSDKNVLVRIHCKRHPGFIVKIFNEIEKLHLNILSSNVMPFANTSLLVTVIAQMDVEFCMTTNDLVKNLRGAILKLI